MHWWVAETAPQDAGIELLRAVAVSPPPRTVAAEAPDCPAHGDIASNPPAPPPWRCHTESSAPITGRAPLHGRVHSRLTGVGDGVRSVALRRETKAPPNPPATKQPNTSTAMPVVERASWRSEEPSVESGS